MTSTTFSDDVPDALPRERFGTFGESLQCSAGRGQGEANLPKISTLGDPGAVIPPSASGQTAPGWENSSPATGASSMACDAPVGRGPGVSRAGLIARGLLAPDGFAPGILPVVAETSEPRLQSRHRSWPVSPKSTPATPAPTPSARAGVEAALRTQSAGRPPCSGCGSVDYARSRVRRGRLLCLDCARGER
jgi:hypothetical protein